MKLDFTNLSYDGKWYPFHKGKLKIRHFPNSLMGTTIENGQQVVSGNEQCRAFKYSLEDMKDFTDANNKPLKCTEEVKQKIFDFQTEVPLFLEIVTVVTQISLGIQKKKEVQEKNS